MYGFMVIDKNNNYEEHQIYEFDSNGFEFFTNPRDIGELTYPLNNESIYYIFIQILGDIIYLNPTFLTNKIKIIKKLSKNGFDVFLNNIKKIPSCEYITQNGNIYRLSHGKLHSNNDLPAIQEIDASGIKHKYWYESGILHRSVGPAIESSNGIKIYYCYGLLHRIDGPALITEYGDKFWYNDGYLHRLNGPAIQWTNGMNEWYYNGERHNPDGPAVICVNGTRKWYYKNKLHRLDGPAIIYSDGYKEWYVNGLFSHGEEYNYDTDNKINSSSTDCTDCTQCPGYPECTECNDTKINKKFSIFTLFDLF